MRQLSRHLNRLQAQLELLTSSVPPLPTLPAFTAPAAAAAAAAPPSIYAAQAGFGGVPPAAGGYNPYPTAGLTPAGTPGPGDSELPLSSCASVRSAHWSLTQYPRNRAPSDWGCSAFASPRDPRSERVACGLWLRWHPRHAWHSDRGRRFVPPQRSVSLAERRLRVAGRSGYSSSCRPGSARRDCRLHPATAADASGATSDRASSGSSRRATAIRDASAARAVAGGSAGAHSGAGAGSPSRQQAQAGPGRRPARSRRPRRRGGGRRHDAVLLLPPSVIRRGMLALAPQSSERKSDGPDSSLSRSCR